MPGDVNLWPKLTGGEVIDLLASLHGRLDRARKAELLERFDLDPTKRTRTCSKGNRHKVALVAALAGDVELLVLDEPTSGLDPLMELTFQQCITEAASGIANLVVTPPTLEELFVHHYDGAPARAGAASTSGGAR
nr:ATP-binding cassette domain-containing protein [Kineococcus sp. TRM81007]